MLNNAILVNSKDLIPKKLTGGLSGIEFGATADQYNNWRRQQPVDIKKTIEIARINGIIKIKCLEIMEVLENFKIVH